MTRNNFFNITAVVSSGLLNLKIIQLYKMEGQNNFESRMKHVINYYTDEREWQILFAASSGILGFISYLKYKQGYALAGSLLSFFLFLNYFMQKKKKKVVTFDRIMELFLDETSVEVTLIAGLTSFLLFLTATLQNE